jgi:hypothetical protein
MSQLPCRLRCAVTVTVTMLSVLLITGGCASNATSIPAWQQSVSAYVREKGGGDPAFLSSASLPVDGRPGFAVIGHHVVEKSTDANGLLIGNEALAGRVWLVYIVGLVKHQEVVDIRLAAMTTDGGKMLWKTGKANKQSLAAYRDYGAKQAHDRFPERKTPPPRYTEFPRRDDIFQLTKADADNTFVATHVGTGAQWDVIVPPAKK